MKELKQCPFCGADGRVVDADESRQFYVTCVAKGCWCSVGENYDRDAMPDHMFRERADAVAAWNRRSVS